MLRKGINTNKMSIIRNAHTHIRRRMLIYTHTHTCVVLRILNAICCAAINKRTHIHTNAYHMKLCTT